MTAASYRRDYEALFREILAGSPAGRYDEMALPSYTHRNRAMAWLFWKRLDTAFALAGDLRGKRVLDFGCGGAVTFAHLQALGCSIAGCDPQAQDLAREVARRLGVDAEIVCDTDELKGRRFDCIFALDVLEHVDDLDGCLDSFAELAGGAGTIVVSGPTENFFYRLGRMLAGFSGHYHVRNIYDIERRFGAYGFENRATRTLYYPVPLFRVSAWRSPGAVR